MPLNATINSRRSGKSAKLDLMPEPAKAQHICESLLDSFATKPEELVEFNQNPEKELEED